MGLAEIIILLALVMAAILFLIIRQGSRYRRDTFVERSLAAPADIDTAAASDPEVQEAMDNGRKIEAIKRYRELTGVGLKEAKDVIDYLMAGGVIDKKKRARPRHGSAAGVRDLLADGRKDEAVDLYARFTGVDSTRPVMR